MMSEIVQTMPRLEAAPDDEGTRLEAALRGDGRAFATLVRTHLPMLYRVAARTTGNESLAEDAVQETLLIAHERLRRYQPGTSFKAWLAAIAMKRSHTLARSERRRAAREEKSPTPHALPAPDGNANARELRARLQQALETLPPKRRRAVIMRLDGGLSHAEIASVLGSTTGSVRVLVHLAMTSLREALQGVPHES